MVVSHPKPGNSIAALSRDELEVIGLETFAVLRIY
jgi:hypothetical protein